MRYRTRQRLSRGCGLLGELACDGTRAVGLFWSAALGWPLVWDLGQETAIQSPAGGTTIAWGGPPLGPNHAQGHQVLELIATDQAAQVERLLGLGASWVDTRGATVILTDPDGAPFQVTGPPA